MKQSILWAAFFCAEILTLSAASRAQEPQAIDPSLRTDLPSTAIDRPRSALDIAEAEREAPKDRIETDRDSFTPAVTTVGQNRFVLEAAYSFVDERRVAETHSYPEFLLRYGLTRRVELRLGWNMEVGGGGSSTSGSSGFSLEEEGSTKIERETVLLYGLKVFLVDQDGLIPESSVVLMARTPTSGPDTDTHFSGTWVFGWNIRSRWKFDAAIRYGTENEENDRFGVWSPSAVLKYEVTERWNAHVEYFGFRSTGKAEAFDRHYVSPGLHYLVTDDLEVGVRLGWGLNDQSSRFFVNAGLGWRY
ncbi:MAG: transporter [Planctomycetes bacterium]|nr:transporter [Planctomycetota bacterium]